jgi:hypothetical protein
MQAQADPARPSSSASPLDRARRRRMAAAALVAALLAALAGCGGDDEGDASTTTTTTEADGTVTIEPPAGSPTTGADGTGGDDVAAASGDAPAAAGADLDEAPGRPDREPFGGFAEAAMSVTDADGETVGLCVLLALAEEQRQRGLMEVTDMAGYDGMLFAFPSDTETGFWMSNTPMPLSIAWFDAEGGLVSTADMEPCPEGGDCPTYLPAGPYRFGLEVPHGELGALRVTAGSRMAVGGACAS